MKKTLRIFITGSADGLGLMAAKLLMDEGNSVLLHARNESRANEVQKAFPQAKMWVTGDLSSIAEIKSVAEQVNKHGHFDAVIHNAAIGNREPEKILTKDGLPHVLVVNTVAPYMLTALIQKPSRLVYLSSGLHQGANTSLDDMLWEKRSWDGFEAYSETKFHDVLLAFAVARFWPGVLSNALEPGWVATKMGGPGASDDLSQGHVTQAWLATSEEPLAKKTGEYYYHKKAKPPHPETQNVAKQDQLLEKCQKLSGVVLPR